MDLLRRELAPISDAGWQHIEEEAKNALRLGLSGRRVVDVTDPRGFDFAAINLGRLAVPEGQSDELRFGIREVLPLVEVRVPFRLGIWDLDDLDRGAKDADLDDLNRAASEVVKFEEGAVYNGFPDGSITGLVGASEFEAVSVAPEERSLLDAVAKAVLRMRYADVDGPYALALGAALYQSVDAGSESGYPLRKRLAKQLGGPIVHAPYLEGGIVISQRGGDAELTLGRDISIGYQGHDERDVRLYFTESFTFRVLGPEAIVALETDA